MERLTDASGEERKGTEVLAMDGETFYCPKQMCDTIAYWENKGEVLTAMVSVKTIRDLMLAGF